VTSENPKNPIDPQQSAGNASTEAQDHNKNPNPPTVVGPDPPPPPAKQCEVTVNTKRDWIDWWTLRLEGFGLFVLCIYTVATIAIWCANKKVAEDTHQSVLNADRNFRIDERAWMGPETVKHSKLSDDNVSIGMVLQNTGKTPALDYRDGILVLPFGKDQPFRPIYPTGSKECATEHEPLSARTGDEIHIVRSVSTVFPQQRKTPLFRVKRGLLPPLEKLQTGDPILYIFGWASYKDVFGDSHCTHFCAFLSTDLDNALTCESYNDAN
jgi:hypothetical protein